MAVFSLISSLITGLATSLTSAGTGAAAAAGGAAGAAGGAAGGLSLGGLAAAGSAAAGIAGTAMQYVGARKAAKAEEKAEDLRQVQMNLSANRERRQMIRQSIIQRAQMQNAAGATNQPTSSGLTGGLNDITSQTGQNITGVNYGQQLGNQMFGINRQIASGQTMASIGGAIQNAGNVFTQNYDIFNRAFG